MNLWRSVLHVDLKYHWSRSLYKYLHGYNRPFSYDPECMHYYAILLNFSVCACASWFSSIFELYAPLLSAIILFIHSIRLYVFYLNSIHGNHHHLHHNHCPKTFIWNSTTKRKKKKSEIDEKVAFSTWLPFFVYSLHLPFRFHFKFSWISGCVCVFSIFCWV